MSEKKAKILNDLEIQEKNLEEEIKKVKSINDKINLNIQKKFLILRQLESMMNKQEV